MGTHFLNEKKYSYHCNRCKASYPTMESVKKHLKTHRETDSYEKGEKGKSFRCHICSCLVESAKSFRRHLKVHEEAVSERRYECNECGKSFHSKYQLKRHRRIHQEIKPDKHHLCDVCGSAKKTQSDLLKHMKIHIDKREKLACSTCERVFKYRSSFRKHNFLHVMVDMQEGMETLPSKAIAAQRKMWYITKRRRCRICGLKCRSFGLLLSHEQNQHADQKIMCQQCGLSFGKSLHRFHTKFQHSYYIPLMCKWCGKTFLTNYQLKRHELQHGTDLCKKDSTQSPVKTDDVCEGKDTVQSLYRQGLTFQCTNNLENIKKYVCKLCKNVALSRNEHQIHMGTHTGKRTYVCSECNRVFLSKILWKSHHAIIHSKQESFSCGGKMCGKVFRDETTMNKHRQLHLQVRLFRCDTCPRTFLSESSLERHLWSNSHTLPCPLCTKRFPSKKHLWSHMVQHAGKYRCVCSICNKRYNCFDKLRSHRMAQHKELLLKEHGTRRIGGKLQVNDIYLYFYRFLENGVEIKIPQKVYHRRHI